MTSHRIGTGVTLVLGSCISLQAGAAAAVQLFPALGPWGVTTVRLGVAGALVLVLSLIARCISRSRSGSRSPAWTGRTWLAVLVLGASLAGMNGFFFAAIDRIPLSVAVAVEFTGPLVLAAVLSRRARDLVWVGCAGVGMVLLGVESWLSAESLDLTGVIFAAVAGVFWALYILANAKVGATVPGVGGLGMAMLIGGILLAPVGVPGALQLGEHSELLWLVLAVVFFSSVVPYTLELSALRRLPAPVFSVLLSLEPAVAAVAGWLLLDQTFGWLRVAVLLLVVAASVGTTRTAATTKDEILTAPVPVQPSAPVSDSASAPRREVSPATR
ncbi:MAG: EamA family transporter [Micrococcaceae bacterium]